MMRTIRVKRIIHPQSAIKHDKIIKVLFLLVSRVFCWSDPTPSSISIFLLLPLIRPPFHKFLHAHDSSTWTYDTQQAISLNAKNSRAIGSRFKSRSRCSTEFLRIENLRGSLQRNLEEKRYATLAEDMTLQ